MPVRGIVNRFYGGMSRVGLSFLITLLILNACQLGPNIPEPYRNGMKPWQETTPIGRLAPVVSGFLSDQNWVSASNLWGPVERNRSNGEDLANDGKTITIRGTTYAKGLGVHAASDVVYSLAGTCTRLTATVGIDDEVFGNGSVVFQVWGDATKLFDSGVIYGNSAAKPLDVNLSGYNQLKLTVTDAGDNPYNDHADWANLTVTCNAATPPADPTSFSATPTSTTVSLSWNTVSTATSYTLERKTGAGAYAQIAAPTGTATSYTDTGLTASTTYSYRMKAVNSGGSSPGVEVSTTTAAPPPPPPDPSSFTATAASSSLVNLSWSAVTGITSYTLERKTGAGAYAQIAAPNASATSYADSTVTGNTTYTYRLKAVNGAASSPGLEQSVTTPAPPATTDSYLSDLTLNIVSNGWGPLERDRSNGENGATDGKPIKIRGTTYAKGLGVHATSDVRYAMNGLCTSFKASAGIDDETNGGGTVVFQVWTDGTKIYDSGVVNGTAAVKSVNVDVTGKTELKLIVTNGGDNTYNDHADWANATVTCGTTPPPPPPPPPADPSNFTATPATSSSANLSWSAVSGVTGYSLERKTGAGSYTQIAAPNASATSYTDTGLTGSTAYSYRLKAVNGASSSPGVEASLTTPAPPPPPPPAPPPPDPSSFTTIASSSSTVNLSWSAVTGITGYTLERKTGAGAYAQIAAPNASATSYSDSGLTASTTYSYRLRAVNGVSASPGLERTVTTQAAPPPGTDAYLSDLTLNIVSNGWGPLERDRSNGENGATDGKPIKIRGVSYTKGLGVHATSDVRYAMNGLCTSFKASAGIDDETNGGGTVVFQVWTDGTKIYDSGTTNGTAAAKSVNVDVTGKTELKLIVTNGGDNTYNDHADWANATVTCNAVPPPPPPPPSDPATFTASLATSSSASLSWSAVSGVTGYSLERKTGAGSYAQIAAPGSGMTTYTDPGLAASTTYTYRVKAVNAIGSSPGKEASVTTPAPPPPPPPPPPDDPTTFTATLATSSSADLNWSTVTGVTGYTLERKAGTGAYAQIAAPGSASTTYTDTGLVASTTYTYRIKAVGTGGSSPGKEASLTTPTPPPPPPPPPPDDPATFAAVNASGVNIALSWSAVSGVTGYTLERKTGTDSYAQIASPNATSTAYTDAGLAPNTTYTYRVRAVNAGGSSPGVEASATTSPPPPPPPPADPTTFTATLATSSSVNLGWSAVSGVTGYTLERRAGAGSYAQIAAPGPSATSYSESGLAASTTYTYRIKAVGTGGSSPGKEASVTTPTPPPPPPPVCSSGPCLTGQWSGVIPWPVVTIHATLLPDGRVLAFDGRDLAGQNGGFTTVDIWNPVTDAHVYANNTTSTLFCSGNIQLPDGRVLYVGGNIGDNRGIKDLNIFDPTSVLWSRGPDMQQARWYPTATNAANGEVLVIAGTDENYSIVTTPQVYQANGTWRYLTGVSKELDYYPRAHLAPDGRVFFAGPESNTAYLSTSGTGLWTQSVQRDAMHRDYGSDAMYDIGKILFVGGGPSTNLATLMDVNGPSPVITTSAPLATGRRQLNLTILADGKVLASGGNASNTYFVDNNNPVLSAELWNPATGQWSLMSSMSVSRQYHSTALLLPDGRVLVGGEGYCSECLTNRSNVQIFTPPYLFQKDGSTQLAVRPVISSLPAVVGVGQNLNIQTPDAASIGKVALVKLGAVTHSYNSGQRYVPLSFVTGTGNLTATLPSNPNVVPAGYYMVFIVGTDGVPSVASMVRVTN